jgi:hypothetical protein
VLSWSFACELGAAPRPQLPDGVSVDRDGPGSAGGLGASLDYPAAGQRALVDDRDECPVEVEVLPPQSDSLISAAAGDDQEPPEC